MAAPREVLWRETRYFFFLAFFCLQVSDAGAVVDEPTS